MDKSAKLLKDAVSSTKDNSLFYLLSVSWGLWNVTAATLSLLLPSSFIPFIWGTMVAGGVATQLFLYTSFKSKKGFMLTSASNVGKVWLVIAIGIVEATFILDMFAPVINDMFVISLVAIFVGIGLTVTGILVKSKMTSACGIIWLLSSNLFAIFWAYSFQIHICISFVTMIAAPLIRYYTTRRQNDAR